ncbi:hypothetical protein [Chitinophaga caseinilytica]|uniref:hypothetical protein n=1 Tax=Chitinophaga caseinilytica TaxID=2267521 RepID=UPI003C2E4282
MTEYKVQSPVLFIVFNRPGTTQQVFDRIRAVKPSRLYIAADGPRAGRPDDDAGCAEVRRIVQNVDWDCEVKTLFSEVNKGCKIAVSDGITWFFDNEEEGIVLEDDCLPATSFFAFCDQMLERYRHNDQVFHIAGTNKQFGRQWGEGSYYFSGYLNVWGWASWRRVWRQYDRNLERYTDESAEAALKKVMKDRFLVSDWLYIFRKLKSGEINTWDYQFNFLAFFEGGLSIAPNVNLITNIGFGTGSTHTHADKPDPFAFMPIVEMPMPIVHPALIVPQTEADAAFLRKEHHLDARWREYMKPGKRLVRWYKRTFEGKKDL